MQKIATYIEIVRSTEPGLSSLSDESCQAIYELLTRHYKKVQITIVNEQKDLDQLVGKQPDLVFLGMKFIPQNPKLGWGDPQKIWLADYLEMHDIASTGSGHLAHQLEFNKSHAKQRALDLGLKTSPYYVAKQNQPQSLDTTSLLYPLFVKPVDRGGGLGIDSNSVVHNFEALTGKIRTIANDHHSDSLIEEYLPGREFSVAILRDIETDEYVAMPLELVAPADKDGVRILSGKIKSADTENFLEVTAGTLKDSVTALALDIFYAIGARDYGRIDIRLDEAGVPNFLEANLIPSLISGYGNFPKACSLNRGLDYESMILAIVNLAMQRALTKTTDVYEEDVSALPVFDAILETI